MILSKFLVKLIYALLNNGLSEVINKIDINYIILPLLVLIFVLYTITSEQLKKIESR